MGLVDANYLFVYADVGAEGKASDGGVWKKSDLFQLLHHPENVLNVPKPELIPGVDHPIPYFIVGDDAFALGEQLMKPFPHTGLDDRGRIFNYRLSRARRCVENAFGILSTRFRIFRKEIEMRPEGAQKVVLAAVVLHNMLRIKCGASYIPQPA